MIRRKFSGVRLYKLIKRLVILVSAILLLIGSYLLVTFYDRGSQFLVEPFERCNELWPPGKGKYILDLNTDCYMRALEEIGNWVKYGYVFTGIGIGLLVIFYGGTWFYKYLFPVIDKKQKKSQKK